MRPRGGGTKLGWGQPAPEPDVELCTAGLDRVVQHNASDLTAVLEAGVRLEHAQEVFTAAGQMLALDPPLGAGKSATIGGVVATGDSGPLRHRYGGARDLLLGVTVALSDGTIAKAGGKVIKNVAGYDLAKLFTGSFGTLAVILEAVVRLHPRPPRHVTVTGAAEDPERLAGAARSLSHASFEIQSLDVSWSGGGGSVLARFGGAAPEAQAQPAARLLSVSGLDAGLTEDDEALWERQRARQRSAEGAVVRVSGLQSRLGEILSAAERAGCSVVGRAGLGICWVTFERREDAELVAAIVRLRRELAPLPCVVLDAPVGVREALDVWDGGAAVPLELMRRVKARFDPQGSLNPGIFVGGI